VHVVVPKSHSGSYYPVGEQQKLPEKRSRSRGGGYGGDYQSGGPGGSGSGSGGGGYDYGDDGSGYGGSGGPGGRGGANGSQQLTKLTGELGTTLVTRVKANIAQGHYGEVLARLSEVAARRQVNNPYGGGYGSGGGSGYPGADGGYPGADGGSGYPGAGPSAGSAGSGGGGSSPGMELGAPGGGGPGGSFPGSGGGGSGAGMIPGGPGGSGPGMGMGAPGGPGRGPGVQGGGVGDAPDGVQSLAAGIVMLGEGTSKELLEAAEDQGLDVLVLFDVNIKKNYKTGLVTNETKMVVYDVKKAKGFYKCKGINNVKVQIARKEGMGDDEDIVEAAFEKMFTALDENQETGLKMKDIPDALTPDNVKSYVTGLISSEQFDRLPVLAEIKFFHHRGLITDEMLTKAFQHVLGELDGAKLAEGKPVERLAVVESLIEP
jgi:hypothetical protein